MKEYPEVLNAFLAAHKEENAEYYEEICDEMSKIVQAGDRSNGSVSLNAAAQIYGGFMIHQIDEFLVKYARKSFEMYRERYRGQWY